METVIVILAIALSIAYLGYRYWRNRSSKSSCGSSRCGCSQSKLKPTRLSESPDTGH